MLSVRKSLLLGGAATLALLAAATAVYLEQVPLLTWYYVRGLSRAEGEAERDAWVGRLRGLRKVPLAGLIDVLRRPDPKACANSQAALTAFGTAATDVAGPLADAFPGLSSPGQRAALDVAAAVVQARRHETDAPQFVFSAAARLLTAAASVGDAEVRGRALVLAGALLEARAEEVRGPCRDLARACLRDADKANRLQAVRLALRPDVNLLEQVVPLLTDPDPEVRRAALLAVGPEPDAVATDDLLQWLHDPDADVRSLCEKALRGRGLQDSQIKLGRFLTDQRPGARLQVLDVLRKTPDVEPGAWLRRLTHDPAPAVRAAAVRAATEHTHVDLTDRIEQMAQDDPSPTVRQLARYYLASPKSKRR
jgi:HEAT repeat protein